MQNTIKLIACDLDGTLLLHGAQACNEELFPIIEELASRGIAFVPASGRQYPSLQRLFSAVKDKLTYLCENGSLVMHLDQVLVKHSFEDSLAMELSHAILEREECEVLISGERTCYVIPRSSDYVRHLREDVGNHVCVIDTPERITEEIIKVSFFTKAEFVPKIKADLGTRFQTRCQMVTSGHEWIDFAPLGTGKGSALRDIGESLGILPHEMVAFGDNENDRTMLELVGHPYLMEHCNPTMRDISAKKCCKVEDTLREILKQI